MKRVTLRLMVIGATFVLGVAAATLIGIETFQTATRKPPALSVAATALQDQTAANETRVSTFCDLVREPEKYHGKIVRLDAVMHIGIENTFFADARCGFETAAIVSFETEAAQKAVRKAREGKGKERWAVTLDTVVTGKFVNAAFTGCCTKAPFQFEILSIEKAARID